MRYVYLYTQIYFLPTYICVKNTRCNSYFGNFVDRGAEEPHSSGKSRVIQESTTDSSRKCGALQEGNKHIYTQTPFAWNKSLKVMASTLTLSGLHGKHKWVYTP